jgi:hypothetical protein
MFGRTRAKTNNFNYINMKGKDVNLFTGLSVDEANEWLKSRTKALYYPIRTGDGYVCKQCSSIIKQTTLYISMHIKGFQECAGGGEVQNTNLAFCPNCEGQPQIARACIHE